jgi:hypothetical protein
MNAPNPSKRQNQDLDKDRLRPQRDDEEDRADAARDQPRQDDSDPGADTPPPARRDQQRQRSI